MEGNSILACSNEYFYDKLYQSYIFTSEIDNVIKQLPTSDVVFQDDSLLNYLEEKVDENYDYHFLDMEAKSNILNLIQFLRNDEHYKKREDYKQVIERINAMINKLNNSTEEIVADFYCLELTERFELSSDRIRALKTGALEIDSKEVKNLICCDILVLLNLNADEKSFNSVFEDLLFNEFVITSIRKMMGENPKLFKDKRIYERVKKILKTNSKVIFKEFDDRRFYKNNNEIYKKLIKIQRGR